MNDKFKGTGVALVTPFNQDQSIDFESLENLVNLQINNGIEYLVITGSTAESVTLSFEEKKQIKKFVSEINKGRVPLVLGIGGSNTQNVIKSIEDYDLSDIDAILSVSPNYNKPTQEGIYQHYQSIASSTDLPIILYNVPSRTGSNISAETTVRIAHDFENVIGIKEASGNLVQMMNIIKNTPDDFLMISGDDVFSLPLISAGGAGVISVIGQAYPALFSEMIRLGLQSNFNKAYKIHYQLMKIMDLIFKEGNPAGIKSLLNTLGICSPVVRLPLVSATQYLRKAIEEFDSQLKGKKLL